MHLLSEESAGTARWERSYALDGDYCFHAQAAGGQKPLEAPNPDREWVVWVGGNSRYDQKLMQRLRESPEFPPGCRWIRFEPDGEEFIVTTESALSTLGAFVAEVLVET